MRIGQRGHWAVILVCYVTTLVVFQPVTVAATITLPAVLDNTLLRYDPTDPGTSLNSNGSGDFFSAGLTFTRNEIRRGLIKFDLSGVPQNVQVSPGSVQLRLQVIGIPRRDTTPRPFWVVGLSGLAQSWGEGASDADVAVSGSGSGAPAQLGDATWFHTSYDQNIHNLTDFVSGGPGFWTQQGALGNAAIKNPGAIYGAPAGIAGSIEGPVDFTGAAMENDVIAWLANPASNFGWIVVGDEGVDGPNASSKRDFASRQHANVAFHPVLSFDVVPVPEPTAIAVSVIGLASAAIAIKGRRRAVKFNT